MSEVLRPRGAPGSRATLITGASEAELANGFVPFVSHRAGGRPVEMAGKPQSRRRGCPHQNG